MNKASRFHTAIYFCIQRYAKSSVYAGLQASVRYVSGMVGRYAIAEIAGSLLPFISPIFQPDEYHVKFIYPKKRSWHYCEK